METSSGINKSEIFQLIKQVHLSLLNEYNIELINDLKDTILKVKDDECFDKFIELYFDFKHQKDFLLVILECKEVYFTRFFKYLNDLEINKKDWDCYISKQTCI